jgi:hypothetical protein
VSLPEAMGTLATDGKGKIEIKSTDWLNLPNR